VRLFIFGALRSVAVQRQQCQRSVRQLLLMLKSSFECCLLFLNTNVQRTEVDLVPIAYDFLVAQTKICEPSPVEQVP
jgi:hypothetical protein